MQIEWFSTKFSRPLSYSGFQTRHLTRWLISTPFFMFRCIKLVWFWYELTFLVLFSQILWFHEQKHQPCVYFICSSWYLCFAFPRRGFFSWRSDFLCIKCCFNMWFVLSTWSFLHIFTGISHQEIFQPDGYFSWFGQWNMTELLICFY